MARKSIIKSLPSSFRKHLDRLILEEKLTITALRDFIASCDALEALPSRSAVGDYAKKKKDEAKETALFLKESREMASAIAQELGPESVEGEQGRLLIEMLRTFLFRFIREKRKDPTSSFEPADFAKMARALHDMSKAMQMEQDFAKRIKEDARREVEQEVKERVSRLGSAQELKQLSDDELEKKIAELAASTK